MAALPDELTALSRLAARHWPIIESEPVLVMHRENTVFRVQTSKGPAALRLHRQGYHSNAALQSELDCMAVLADGGLSVPQPISAADGSLLVELNDKGGTVRMADMLTWLDGAPLGRSGEALSHPPDQCAALFKSIGAAMARMHILSDAWTPPPAFFRPRWDRGGLVGDAPFWGRFWEVSNVSAAERTLLHSIRIQCRHDLDAYVNQGADFGLIHADLVRENVLVSGGNVHFIDFDDSGFGFRMFDIATALIKNRREPEFARLKLALFTGYEAIRPLRPHDKAALFLFMALRSLTYLGWAEARREEPGIRERLDRMKQDAFELSREYLGGSAVR
jgi:Ser/Thr protein kinase RdoA (MazF antagonist)